MASSQTMEDDPRIGASGCHTLTTCRTRERRCAVWQHLSAAILCAAALSVSGVVAPGPLPVPFVHAAEIGSLSAVEDPTATLRPGTRGPKVVALQQALWRAGFLSVVDGVYGSQTEQSVRNFQREAGVSVDGIAGSTTLTLLYDRYGERQLVHIVKRGETLWELAKNYDVTVDELRRLNRASTDTIRPGERLRLPAQASLAHRSLTVPALQTALSTTERAGGVAAGGPTPLHYVIRRGDSLSVLAHRFGSSVEEIAAENGIASPSNIRVGQDLIIPVELRGGAIGDDRWRSVPRPGFLLWPVEGPISSPYGLRIHPISGARDFHSGLDIAVPKGTPVRAAFRGVVRESRWMGGLGLAVVIDHGNGITTRYGHNSKLLVKPGHEVRRGEIVAEAGSTGLSTGPHVHFMVLRDGETMNPINWLP